MTHGYKTEGIVLKRTNFGEADRILTIFSKHFGKIKVLAKGIRKVTSKKGGSLELFNWVRIFVAQGKNLDLVAEVELMKSFRTWRKDLKKVASAYYYCELVDKVTAEGVPNIEVFSLLAESLKNLSFVENGQENFAIKLLVETGFWPEGKSLNHTNLDSYIEKVVEKKINSNRVFKDLVS